MRKLLQMIFAVDCVSDCAIAEIFVGFKILVTARAMIEMAMLHTAEVTEDTVAAATKIASIRLKSPKK